jgi:hypothetical protein
MTFAWSDIFRLNKIRVKFVRMTFARANVTLDKCHYVWANVTREIVVLVNVFQKNVNPGKFHTLGNYLQGKCRSGY